MPIDKENLMIPCKCGGTYEQRLSCKCWSDLTYYKCTKCGDTCWMENDQLGDQKTGHQKRDFMSIVNELDRLKDTILEAIK